MAASREVVTIFFHALIIAFFVRVFFYQPFNIPSGSMQSTLLIGDYLFVSKLSYGYSRYTFPFGVNLFSGPDLGQPAQARRRRRVQAAARQLDRLHQARDRPAGRRDRGARRHRLDQRPRGAAPARSTISCRSRTTAATRRTPRYEETLPEGVKYTVLDAASRWRLRQRRALQGAGRPLFHDGRQPRQLHRQPRAAAPLRRRLSCPSRTWSAAPTSSSSRPRSTSRARSA